MDYMENILEELYLCGIGPEYYKKPDTSEYAERLARSDALAAKLSARLGAEEKALYQELRENLDVVFDLEMMQSFVMGYILAAQIMIDVTAQTDNPELVKIRSMLRKKFPKG